MQTRISVIVPTYKRPQLLKSCLLNLCNQTFDSKEYEIIVVSDGPDQETALAVSGFEECQSKTIRFLSLPSKKGPAAARNLGWQSATGILIAFTDDDCLPEKTWLENIWKQYNYESEIAFTGKVIVPVSQPPTDFELNTKGLETGDFVTANCVCTKTTLEAIGGFDEAFSAAWREDSDLEFKLIERKVSIIKLDDAVVIHPVRKAPWGISIKEQKKTLFNALLFKKYPALYRQRVKSKPSWRYYLIILFFTLFIATAFTTLKWISLIAFIWWISLTAAFIFKRLSSTKKSLKHIIEMIATSVVIPFLSVYWSLYGAIKYRVWFF